MDNHHELKEAFHDFLAAKRGSFLTDLFFDYSPAWREMRYKIIVESLRKAAPGSVPEGPSWKKRYLRFLSSFRKRWREEQTDEKELEKLYAEAHHFFLKIEMREFTEQLVTQMEKAGLPTHKRDELETTWHALEQAPRSLKLPLLSVTWQFLQGQFNVAFDPFRQENTPYHLFDLQTKMKKIAFIRMGTPTHEGLFSSLTHKAHINEEFIAFLEDYERKGKRHLYINLQNRILGYPGYDESPRCKALEDLALHHPKTFFITTFAKNSLFWHQAAPFDTLDNASLFKKEFLNELSINTSGYHFCKEAHITQSLLKKLLSQVHEEFFASSHSLTLQQRKDFIELFYLLLTEHLIETLEPDSVNITCKDGIDRAATASALYFLFDRLKTRTALTPEAKLRLKAILFAPALIVKKRPPRYDRFRRFQSASLHLHTHFGLK